MLSCSNCEFEVDQSTGGFAHCDVCQVSILCTRCVIMQDISICTKCEKSQTILSQQLEEERIQKEKEQEKERLEKERKKADKLKCYPCGKEYDLQECRKCGYDYCDSCRSSVEKHVCAKCDKLLCKKTWVEKCCNHQLCETCYANHRITDCYKTCYYTCSGCSHIIMKFDQSETFKCPVLFCPKVYGCIRSANCGVSVKKRGIYCVDHTSKTICPGCKLRYALDNGYGFVKILSLLGSKVRRREYCGPCLGRIRTLVESILIVLKRNNFAMPKIIMDMIVYKALDFL
jgi:hypothetical protein